MNWTRLVAIVIGAGVVSSFTDWFFAGDWLHRRYTYPEIWRQGAEGRAIALSSPLPFLTCGVFAYATARLGLHSMASTVRLAAAVRASTSQTPCPFRSVTVSAFSAPRTAVIVRASVTVWPVIASRAPVYSLFLGRQILRRRACTSARSRNSGDTRSSP